MSKPIVAVFTASSNTGTAAIECLTEKFADKVTVRGIVRKPANAEHLEDTGVEIVVGDIKKSLLLKPSFEGVNVCYFATPGTTNRADLGKRFVDACIEHGVEYGVFTSIIGADQKATSFQRQFAEIEEYALSKVDTPVKLAVGDKGKVKFKPIILRAAPFYQNVYGCLSGIQQGTFYYPLEHEKMSHVDFEDIGKCVAHILVNPAPHAGKIYNLIGQVQAGDQMAQAIMQNASLGCKYAEVDDATAVAAFQALGLQPWIAEGNVEMLRWMREGGDKGLTSDIEAITGEKPTKFGTFVKSGLKPMLD